MGITAKRLLSSSSIVFVGTLITSAFSYIYNMLMGRMLGPVQYGEMVAVISLLTVVSVGNNAILTITMRYAGELHTLKRTLALGKLFRVFSKYMFILAAIFFIVGTLLSRPISNFFMIQETAPVIIIFSSFLYGFTVMVNRGILQGSQRFLALSVINSFEIIIKLALAFLLVWLGFALNGAIAAFVISGAIAYLVTFIPLKKLLGDKSINREEPFHFDRKEILRYSWPTLIATALLAISINLDIILVKHYFPAREAGLYAAVSTIAKIILYATGPVISVMFPMISENKTVGSKHYRIFLFSLMLTLVSSLVILSVYAVAPAKIISILYGSAYIDFYHLLPEIGLAVLFYSLVNLMVNYYLAIKDFFFIWLYAASILIQVIITQFWHPSILVVVRTMIVSLCVLFVAMLAYYLYSKRKQLINFLKNGYNLGEVVN